MIPLYHDPAYTPWRNMLQRCLNPRNPNWPDYGGRGIMVCQRWRTFTLFREDMGPRPPGASIERVRNEDGYQPGNCVWGTPAQQSANRRSNIYLEHAGRRMSQAAWSKELGISPVTINRRRAAGWSDERIITTPLDVARGSGRRKEA